MKHIVIFGAGKSSTYLIDYMIGQLPANNWKLTVIDADLSAAEARTRKAPNTTALQLNVDDASARRSHVASADIVISLLPASLHYLIALDCIESGRNLLTASYIDPNIERLRGLIEAKGLLFLCEMGLDPGIDHMSAMRIIHRLQKENAKIISFRSHCGGLIAPESDDNPWRYKVSWNPRNVVLAGKAGAVYKQNGKQTSLSYEALFDQNQTIMIDGLGMLAFYPNRDSVSYIDLYRLHDASDFIRTTLRYPEFCSGWKMVIDLKLTDETVQYETNGRTLKQFFAEHFALNKVSAPSDPLLRQQLEFLGVNDNLTVINRGRCSAADVMQFVMETKLSLQANDRDMIVMLHEFEYLLTGKKHSLKSCLVVKGDDQVHTAMARTVGLPLAIAAKMILQGKITLTGLHIPVISELYEPILEELGNLGIVFTEKE